MRRAKIATFSALQLPPTSFRSQPVSMAFPLSSFAALSQKLSTNLIFTHQPNFPLTHSILRSNGALCKHITRYGPLRIRCRRTPSMREDLMGKMVERRTSIVATCHVYAIAQECSDCPTNSLVQEMKKLEKAIAAILIISQVSLPLPMVSWTSWPIFPAKAVLYSPDTKVPRTGELALRRAIPANTSMKFIQDSLEDISYLLRIPQRKPYGTMESNVKKALKIATSEKESILASIPKDLKEKGSVLHSSLIEGKGGLQALLQYINDKDPDKVSVGLASALDTIADLELLQAPGLQFLLPQQYMNYPRLSGRATVEFLIEKGDGSYFTQQAGGEPKKTASIQVVLDGYSAPLTAGNVAKLVTDGLYNGSKFRSTDLAILSDPGLDNSTSYSVPLEIKPSGQFEPLYKTALSIQDGELPVLPLSVYGAVAMSHNEDSEEYSSPNQFFFYLYDKRNSGLGGLSFDEGQFSVFGYTTMGKEILSQIKTGDIIRSATIVDGRERLVLPDAS